MKNIDAKIKEIIKKTVLNQTNEDSNKNNKYIYTKVMTNDVDISDFYNPLKLTNSISDVSQTLVLIDKKPELNWAHECEYNMFNGDTGEYIETIQAQMPPASFFLNNEDYEPIGPLVKLEAVSKENIELNPIQEVNDLFNNITGEKYAILFSGMSNNRHLNDLEYLYRVLIDIYKFDPKNITALNYDGTLNYSGTPQPIKNWPGDNTPYRIKINGQGTKSSLINALNNYKSKLTDDDLLFIHSNNHGDGPRQEGEIKPCTICCYPNCDSLTDADFGKEIATFPQLNTLVVMMEQCHSGGFSEPTIKNSKAINTTFSAACLPWKSSMGGADFDPYAYNWIKKISESNQIAVYDAYVYAKEHTVSYDTPNEADKPQDCSKKITLNNKEKSIGIIACNGKYVCAEDGGGKPLIANRDWVRSWETFEWIDLGNNQFALKACNGKYVCAENGGNDPLIANRDWTRSWETFTYNLLNSNSLLGSRELSMV
jgi:hypothetical protein